MLTSKVQTISADTLQYAPIVIAAMQAAELSTANGDSKKQAVVNAVIQGSGQIASDSNPNVAAIGSLVNLFASIFNALGIFQHKPAPAHVPA